jgi:hypothetical protein
MTSRTQAPSGRSLPPQRLVLWGAVALALVAAAFVLHRHATRPDVAAVAEQAAHAARPAFTAAEEQYIRALWPIHGDVQRSAVRVTLGQIFYLTQDQSREELGKRVEEALASFGTAETRLLALQPPASLVADHDAYLAAVRLFRQSAVEVQKTVADGREEHLQVAYPKSQEASDKIREVGGKFWPHEFPAH